MPWLDDVTLDTVVVHTITGSSFKGLRSAVHDDCLVLREALLLDNDSPAQLNGLVIVPKEQVHFIQVVGA